MSDHLKGDVPISYNYTVLYRLSSLFCITGRPGCLSCIFCDIFWLFSTFVNFYHEKKIMVLSSLLSVLPLIFVLDV